MIHVAREKKPYPKALRRNVISVRNKGKVCVCCADIATQTVVIGNDANPDNNEIYIACHRHAALAFDQITTFYKHYHGRQENLAHERSLNGNTNEHTSHANQGA